MASRLVPGLVGDGGGCTQRWACPAPSPTMGLRPAVKLRLPGTSLPQCFLSPKYRPQLPMVKDSLPSHLGGGHCILGLKENI